MPDPRFPPKKITPGEYARTYRAGRSPIGPTVDPEAKRIAEGVAKAKETFLRRAADLAAKEQNMPRLRPAKAAVVRPTPAPSGPIEIPQSGMSKAAGALGMAAKLGAGAAGFTDLAQMAEPGRKDIGFMGIGVDEEKMAAIYDAIKRKLGLE